MEEHQGNLWTAIGILFVSVFGGSGLVVALVRFLMRRRDSDVIKQYQSLLRRAARKEEHLQEALDKLRIKYEALIEENLRLRAGYNDAKDESAGD
jgi:hypothetical protein